VTTPLAQAVAMALEETVEDATPVGGGCISEAERVTLAGGTVVFAKSGANLPDGLLAVEAEGLAWLRQAHAVRVPAVIAVGDELLVLEWIEPGTRTADTDETLGRGLAALHRTGAGAFGWHRDGFIGSLPQRNTPPVEGDWPRFWLTRRIQPLTHQARRRGTVDDRVPALVDRLEDRIGDLAGPAEPPARVHGDLWWGNVHADRQGEPWLIDPAAYGGHREVDLAMLHLFGAPSPGLVEAYHEVFPLAEGWRDRLRLWQLEPLLVHAVLFGGSYGDSVRALLDHFL
jgi:fructosamine-3-kinase